MKIAILKSRLDKSGGLEKYARHTAAAFAARGCEVTVLTTGTPPQMPCRVISLGERLPFSVSNVFAFDYWCRRWLRKNPQDRVLGMDRNSWQTHYRAGSGSHRAYLERRSQVESLGKRLSFKINPLHQLTLRLERRAFEDPDLQTLITNSHLVRGEILDHYSISPDKVKVIHNGVEWRELQPAFDSWQQNHNSSLTTLLFVGHGFRRKGLGPLLHALSHLPRDSYRLLIVGEDRDPKPFQRIIDRLNLPAKILGPQKPITPYLQMADALILPTLYDPCANVTLEALAMGLFVITSSANGASELLTPETGLITDTLTSDDLFQIPKKTPSSAQRIRDSVAHLDFPNQLNQLIDAVLA